MALDALVDSAQLDSDLKDVADAIREKSGGTGSLTFPSGFVSEISKCYALVGISEVDSSILSGDIIYQGTYLRPCLFSKNTHITSFVGNNVTSANGDPVGAAAMSRAFQDCTNLISVSLPKLTNFYHVDYIFQGCSKLTTINLDWKNITQLGTALFNACVSLNIPNIVLPNLIGNIWSYCFQNCKLIEAIDFGYYGQTLAVNNNHLYTYCFNGCEKLSTLIIRQSNMRTLDNLTAFEGTPFANGGTGGTIYVPRDLISSYQTATNWSTLYGYGTVTFSAIEDSEYATHYADGTEVILG